MHVMFCRITTVTTDTGRVSSQSKTMATGIQTDQYKTLVIRREHPSATRTHIRYNWNTMISMQHEQELSAEINVTQCSEGQLLGKRCNKSFVFCINIGTFLILIYRQQQLLLIMITVQLFLIILLLKQQYRD